MAEKSNRRTCVYVLPVGWLVLADGNDGLNIWSIGCIMVRYSWSWKLGLAAQKPCEAVGHCHGLEFERGRNCD